MHGAGGESQDTQSVSAENVRLQLSRILSSEVFVPSQRLCRFLRFVVERTLDNNLDGLKEFVIALEVFDRSEQYNPSVDSIVRVEARRLRTKLKAYYEGPGSRDPVLIGLRPGSYVPLFCAHTPDNRPSVPTPPPDAAGDPPARVTVAVLPFVNMSPEPDQDYFCDGITEEIINALASVDSLSVVARTSAFQFKGKAMDLREVGRLLGANVVVEGSVRKSGNQLRITAQAIDAASGVHLWSETYRRELSDVFAIQEDLSNAIARQLRVRLPSRAHRGGGGHPPSLDAYTRFLKAMFLLNQQNLGGLYVALAQFRELTQVYPGYAAPYAGIATANAALSLFGVVSGQEVREETRRNAEQAVRLDPDSSEGWAVLGGIHSHWDYDWERGEQCFLRATALQPANSVPRSWHAMVLAMQGRLADAEAELSRAITLNPLAAADHARMAYVHYLQGDDARASAQIDSCFATEPDYIDGRFVLALMLFRRGDHARAVEVLSRNLDRIPIALHIGLLAAAQFRLGNQLAGREGLRRLEAMAEKAYVTPLANAYAYVGSGDFPSAVESLRRAIADRAVFACFLKVDPFYEPLRTLSGYAELLGQLNLSSPRAASGR